MLATIHPYKGYLNTNFYIHVKAIEQQYHVYKKNCTSSPILSGKIIPNESHFININHPGDFTVIFENGEKIDINVEDGYKFGGSSYKTSFIFDENPWCFIVMNDRTYFYNRETRRAFVEPISPDTITEIATNYVMFSNEGQNEQTIFSLDDEQPVICISDLITFNNKIIVWKESLEDKNELCLYTLENNSKTIDKYKFDNFIVDQKNQQILFHLGNNTFKISLSDYKGVTQCVSINQGNIVSVIAPNLVVSYQQTFSKSKLSIYDIDTKHLIKNIEFNGHLAEINDIKLFDIRKREQVLREVDVSKLGIPEMTISASYQEIYIYPCEWNIFYTIKTITLTKNGSNSIIKTETSTLNNINTDSTISIKEANGKFEATENTFCFFNYYESYSISRDYNESDYVTGGSIYLHNNNIYLYKESCLYKLSQNGHWSNPIDMKLDFSYYKEFGVVKDIDSNMVYTLDGKELGKMQSIFRLHEYHIKTDRYFIFSNAQSRTIRIHTNNIDIPIRLSPNMQIGLFTRSNKFSLYNFKDDKIICESILEDILDSSNYQNVLLSEDGQFIMYRDKNMSIVKNISNGTIEKYNNLSYINNINGIRLLFSTPSSLQPILVNPTTGKRINCNEMLQYHFISPDEQFYADTKLKEYREYYYKETNELLSAEEYYKLVNKYAYPWNETRDSESWEQVKKQRTQLILENIAYLKKQYPKLLNNDQKGTPWENILDEMDRYGVEHFLQYFIGIRGIAVIRKVSDDSEYARINLGDPLKFINYVSFSYDSKYVAIAGYRESGGLLIIYNLASNTSITHINTNRAVWNVAFSVKNAFASYTSNPETFFAENEDQYSESYDKHLIKGNNFLTFSPDGDYFALSQQGYISKYDKLGNTRDSWGHQPSSIVEIRLTSDHQNKLLEFSDLGNAGISDTSKRESVASVSFSNHNTRLMMVSNDGVVIIRNLHL